MLESYYAQFSSETSNSEDSGDIIEVSDAVIDSSKKNEPDNAQLPGTSTRPSETRAASNNSTVALITTMAAVAAMPQKHSPASSKSSSSSSKPKNAQRARTSKHKIKLVIKIAPRKILCLQILTKQVLNKFRSSGH